MKYLHKILILVFLVAATNSMIAQEKSPHQLEGKPMINQPKFDKKVLQDLKVDVVYLASDLMEGRESGQPGEQMAADYIASRFEEIGLTPKGTEGWEQPFPFKELVNPHANPQANPHGNPHGNPDAKPHAHAHAPAKAASGIARNVIGYLDNQAANTVVIGAHYDHLGMGASGSLHAGEKAIHNGADDNASGVAAMFNIAKQLKASPKAKNNNYLFIAFSAEEKGLFGSKYFVENPTIELAKINYMLNMDMVGRLNAEKVLAILGVGTSPTWKPVLERVKVANIKAKTSESGIGPSDHTSFYLKSIPVLHFFTGQHSDYHKPGDDSHLVNYEGIYEVSNYLVAIIEKMNGGSKLAFMKTQESSETPTISKFKVTLGVMPDYVYDGEGMRIDGVLSGRTAEKAGLEDGDIVLKIGDVDVKDIYGYMDGLSKFEKGDKTKVVVKRGTKLVTKEVEF